MRSLGRKSKERPVYVKLDVGRTVSLTKNGRTIRECVERRLDTLFADNQRSYQWILNQMQGVKVSLARIEGATGGPGGICCGSNIFVAVNHFLSPSSIPRRPTISSIQTKTKCLSLC